MTAINIRRELDNLSRIASQHVEEGHRFEWGDGLRVVNNLLFGVIQITDLVHAIAIMETPPVNFNWTENGLIVTGIDKSCFELNMSSRKNSGEFTIGYSAPDIEKIEYHLFMNQREVLQSTVSALGDVCGINEVSKADSRGVLARNMFSFIGTSTADNTNTLPERLKRMLSYSN